MQFQIILGSLHTRSLLFCTLDAQRSGRVISHVFSFQTKPMSPFLFMFYSLFTEPSTSLMLVVLAGPRPGTWPRPPEKLGPGRWLVASPAPAPRCRVTSPLPPLQDFVTAEFLGTARRLLFHEMSTTPEITKMLNMRHNAKLILYERLEAELM